MTSSKDDIVPNNSELTTPNSELNTRKRVFLVDGNSYLYRAFFCDPSSFELEGIPTNATYAFMNMFRNSRTMRNRTR